MCTCARAGVPLFDISEATGRIVLKFGMWLATHWLDVLQKSRVRNIYTLARADVPLFRILETSEPIALKFGVWLGTYKLGVLQTSKMGHICTCARAHVQMGSFSISLKRLHGLR